MPSIKDKILSGLDIEKQEFQLVALLLLQSAFLGIFFGAFDTAANSLFLGAFPAESLPMAFTVSGMAGILMTALYSYLQERIPFSRLALYNISFIAITTFLLWYGFKLTSAKWHVFLVLVMMGPLNILAMIGFWGTAGRIFTLRQGKRLFGLVDTGQIIGVIISSYAIPVILSFSIKTKDILLVSSVSAGLALIFQSIVIFRNKNLSFKVQKSESQHEDVSFSHLFKNRFVRLMAFFIALSMVVAFFISFSFLAVLKMKYPDETGLAKFLGIFTGTVMIFTLLIKTFVYSKFVKTYGLRTCLIISPVLLLTLTIIAAATGTFAGYTAASSGFIFFFLLIALSRLISVSLKNSIEAPSFKVLYQTITSALRHHVQSRIDGTVNEISALSSGVILFALGLLSFFKIINFSQVLIFILIIWTYIAYNLYKAYKNNLDQSLNSLQKEETQTVKEQAGIASNLLKGDENAARILFVMNMQEKLQPVLYERLIPYFLHHRLEEIQQYALTQIQTHHIYEALDTFKNFDNDDFNNKHLEISKRLADELMFLQEEEKLTGLSRSKIASERELAARLIGNSGKTDFSHHLKFLLRDFDYQVKISAIKATAQLKNHEISHILSEFLVSNKYGRHAFDALITIGEPALDGLEHLFNKSSNDGVLLSRIVRIIGNIGGEKACMSLLHKLEYHDIQVARLSAGFLVKNQFQTNESNDYIVFQTLNHVFRLLAWNIAARVSLKEANAKDWLQKALEDEIKRCFDHLYDLLSLLYDAQSIRHIRQNIEGLGNESADYAIELLEIMIADNLKPILFPIIDESSDHEKIRKLQEYFPVDKVSLNQILLDIINRDYNYIDLWTKACALNMMLESDSWIITNDIIAHLFNSNEMLSQLSALLIFKNQEDTLSKVFKRIPEKNRILFQRNIEKFKKNPTDNIFNKVLEIKELEPFRSIPGSLLFDFSNQLIIFNAEENEETDSLDEDLNVRVYFILEGKVEAVYGADSEVYTKGSFYGGVFDPGYPKNFAVYTCLQASRIAYLSQETFDKYLFDYPEFAKEIITETFTEKHN